jgi:hypothetical protein
MKSTNRSTASLFTSSTWNPKVKEPAMKVETREDNSEDRVKPLKSFLSRRSFLGKSLAVKAGTILMVLIGGSFASSVIADDTLVRFKGAIGDLPVANVAGTPNPDGSFPDVIRNIVRGVDPAGQIWVISDFRADVKVDGRTRVDGRGLLLGGGNTIGTNGNASVFATLICEATPPFTQFSTHITGVPLAANGDFRIDDVLAPAPPTECGSPVLLIRVTPSGAWFAAGIPKLD